MAGGVGFVLLMKSATQNNKELFMINLAGWICLGVGLCYLLWMMYDVTKSLFVH